MALGACASKATDDSTPQSARESLPETVAELRGETPFAFALAVDVLAHDDVDHCKELVTDRAGWVSIAVTKAADGFVFAATRTPDASELAEVERAVRDCDLGLSFALPDAEADNDASFTVEPVAQWAPVHSGDTEGVRWTIYRADANPDLDGTSNACYSIEVGPSSGPALPTTTIYAIPDDGKSLRGLPMSCGSDIGPKPEGRPGASPSSELAPSGNRCRCWATTFRTSRMSGSRERWRPR